MNEELDLEFQRALSEGRWHYAFRKIFVVAPDQVLHQIADCKTWRPDQEAAVKSLVDLRNSNTRKPAAVTYEPEGCDPITIDIPKAIALLCKLALTSGDRDRKYLLDKWTDSVIPSGSKTALAALQDLLK